MWTGEVKLKRVGRRKSGSYFIHLSALHSIIDKWLIVSIPAANRAAVGGSNLELERECVNVEQPMFEGPYVFGWTLSHVQLEDHFLVSSAISLPMTYLSCWYRFCRHLYFPSYTFAHDWPGPFVSRMLTVSDLTSVVCKFDTSTKYGPVPTASHVYLSSRLYLVWPSFPTGVM